MVPHRIPSVVGIGKKIGMPPNPQHLSVSGLETRLGGLIKDEAC